MSSDVIVLINIVLYDSLKSRIVMLSALLFFFRMLLLLGFVWFLKNFRLVFLMTMKNVIGILIENGLNL